MALEINKDLYISDSNIKLGDLIIDSGSNSDGKWIKYSDGNMICWGSKYSTSMTWSAWGSIYAGEISITFPQPFTGGLSIVSSLDQGTNTGNGWTGRCTTTISNNKFTGGTIPIYRPTTYGNTMAIQYIAIGKWK